jgi:Flp pilus assembly protein TadG
MTQSFRLVRNERGAAIALVAVSLAVLLGMGALAVDLGMLMKQREDAQRAADAAALAGASAFMESSPLDAIHDARDRAFEYLGRNTVGGRVIDTSDRDSSIVGGNRYITTSREGTVIVLPDSAKVRVVVRRDSVGSFFSGILGVFNSSVGAKAAAMVGNAGAARCLKPFALPDMWSETDDARRTQDRNGNRLEDSNENWTYSPNQGDRYRSFQDPDGGGQYTGLGSSYRNSYQTADDPHRYYNDYGRQFELKVGRSNDALSPSDFQAWALPGSRGGSDYRDNIAECNTTEIELGQSYESEPGNMRGPTEQGIQDLVAQDPDACWATIPDPSHIGYYTGEVRKRSGGSCSAPYTELLSSPRVALVPLFDPSQSRPGRHDLTFNNIGVFFIQGLDHDGNVVGNFLYFAKGTGAGSESGSLLKQLRLSE